MVALFSTCCCVNLCLVPRMYVSYFRIYICNTRYSSTCSFLPLLIWTCAHAHAHTASKLLFNTFVCLAFQHTMYDLHACDLFLLIFVLHAFISACAFICAQMVSYFSYIFGIVEHEWMISGVPHRCLQTQASPGIARVKFWSIVLIAYHYIVLWDDGAELSDSKNNRPV